MKKNKTICLDDDIIEQLENVPNSSKIINDLLREYFGCAGSYKKEELLRKEKELATFIEEKKEELLTIKKNLENVNNEEERIKKLFKDVPQEILDDFSAFPKMTEEIMEQRIVNLYSINYPTMNYNLIRNAFKEFFKNRKI